MNFFYKEIIKTDVNYNYNIMMNDLKELKTSYQFLKVGSIGYSVLNKQIPYVKIGIGKKKVLYHCSIHANEWITAVLGMKFIERFCIKYMKNESFLGIKARKLFNECSLFIIPMMNPDGVDLVTGALDKTSNYYKQAKKISRNYPIIPFPSGWKANIKGVDFKNYQPI